jgi:co-chaperonin GroES (HSP10)
MENKSGITPTGDLVLLLCPPIADVTAGGIHIPDEAKERIQRATRIGYLLAAGSVAQAHPRLEGLGPGDMVILPRYAADFVPVDGVDYLLIRADAVLGKCDRMPDFQFQPKEKSTAEVFGVNDVSKDPPRIARLS